MSWDVYAKIDTGGAEPATVGEAGNYTYNVSQMYYDVLGGDGLRGLHEMVCAEALPLINEACAKMVADPEKYRAMNPPNGWGDYEGALRYLQGIGEMCAEHPKAKLAVR